MDKDPVNEIAAELRKGQLSRGQAWEVAAAVQRLLDELQARNAGLSLQDARAAMDVLNKHRHFDYTARLAAAWAKEGLPADVTVYKHHTQAAINLGALDEADVLLAEGLKLAAAPGQVAAKERLEFLGLRGRLTKQRYVASGDLDDLERSVLAYWETYNAPGNNKPYWHGVNALALATRLSNEGGSLPGGLDLTQLGSELLASLASAYAKNPNDVWIYATWSEVALALDRRDDAELWLYRLIHHPKTTPFVLDAYDRQLREVWGGSALATSTRCADQLAGIMARHMMKAESRMNFSAAEIGTMREQVKSDPSGFEKNYSGERGISRDTLRRMLDSCASIGCVANAQGERLGTGFLVVGAQLVPAWGPEVVFVTNAHVLHDAFPGALKLSEARVCFEVESANANQPVFHSVGELLFTSLPGALSAKLAEPDTLDVTVVRIPTVEKALTGLPLARALPRLNVLSKAFVVGHPRGSGLQLSLHDSLLLDIDDDKRLLHYRTPTDPGNSGSPVFNAQWEVIGLHHAGSSTTPWLHGEGVYEANEGISLLAIGKCAALSGQ